MPENQTPIPHHDGTVTGIEFPLVRVRGIYAAKPHELVKFEGGNLGQVLSLKKDHALVMCLSKNIPQVGSRVDRMRRTLTVKLSLDMMGKIMDPMGRFEGSPIGVAGLPMEEREIDVPPPPLTARAPIKETLKTGVVLTDILLPLGKGQRQLVVGDRKTGKTTYLTQLAQTQIGYGHTVVYASIGKSINEIKRVYDHFVSRNISQQMVLVAATADDPASVISLTPYTAMTVAEYLRDQGNDVVVIFDDLSTHAKYYREISLLARRFPGRDSYPGDMFFAHARLLERAGSFYLPKKKKNVSITALPMAETQEGELTSFIVSNLISITDGHLFFESGLFSRGLRPAINVGLSVTRVGKQTQTPLERELDFNVGLLISEYEKTRSLVRFGAELGDHAKEVIQKGDLFWKLFEQDKFVIFPPSLQLVIAGLILGGAYTDKDANTLAADRDRLLKKHASDVKFQALCNRLTSAANQAAFLGELEKNKNAILV